MLGWVYRGFERWVRGNSVRTGKAVDHIPLWFIRELSKAKLVRVLRYVYGGCPAQRERWRQAGVGPSDLRSSEALRHIPFTTSADIVERPEELFCVGREELIHVLATAGTKGARKKVYLTRDDLDHQVRAVGTHFRRFPGGQRAAAIFDTDLPGWSTGSIMRRAMEEAGMFGVLSATARSSAEQVELIREYEIDVVVSTPAYLHRITVEAGDDLRGLGVRYIHLGGQAWPEEFRREIEAAWDAKVIDCYGSMELACATASECSCRDGLHVAETDLWVEIVDPVSGEVLPDGEEGEVVATTLSRRGMPLVRYRTGDMARLIPRGERCACGMPLRKMSRVRGRVDDVLIIGSADNVYPDEFDRAILSVPGVSDYQLVIEKDTYNDVLHLAVEAEDGDGEARVVLEAALLGIPNVRLAHQVTRTVTFGKMDVVPRGTLSKGRPKSVRIVDGRDMPTAARPF